MKRLLILALLTLTLQFAFAGFNSSILNIRINDNSPFRITIDGQPMGRTSGAITLNDITPGRHWVQISREPRLSQNINTAVLYNGTIDVTANTESYLTVLAGMNKIKIDRIVAINTMQPYPGRPIINPIQPAPVQPNICPPYVPVGPMAMAPYDFDQLVATLHNSSFESTRLQILKQAMPYNHFTTQQVRTLMAQFWFESSKLEVAKAAYTKTLDQHNYYLVNNEFSFGSSVRELGDYLAMN